MKSTKCLKTSNASSKNATSNGVTIRNTKSSINRPLSSFSPSSSTTSSTSALSKNQNKINQSQPTHVDTNMNVSCSSNIESFAFFSPSNSINDSFRKKSGSVSALYLCDTASTKAKKAELKSLQNENNFKDIERQQLTQTQSNNSFSTIPTPSSSIFRRNSMGKKVSVERNINNASQMNNLLMVPQPNKESTSTSSMKVFNSIGLNGATMSSNEYSIKKMHQTPNVFDRLSRSSKK